MFCTWMFHWKSYLMCTRLKIIQISLIYGTTFLYLLTAFTAFESEKAEEPPPPSTLSKRHSGWRWECPVEWFPAAKLWMGLCLADLLTQLFHWRCVALQLPVELSSFFKRLDWTNGDYKAACPRTRRNSETNLCVLMYKQHSEYWVWGRVRKGWGGEEGGIWRGKRRAISSLSIVGIL